MRALVLKAAPLPLGVPPQHQLLPQQLNCSSTTSVRTAEYPVSACNAQMAAAGPEEQVSNSTCMRLLGIKVLDKSHRVPLSRPVIGCQVVSVFWGLLQRGQPRLCRYQDDASQAMALQLHSPV